MKSLKLKKLIQLKRKYRGYSLFKTLIHYLTQTDFLNQTQSDLADLAGKKNSQNR